MFQAEWDVPLYLGNDADCAAIGEYWAGAAKDCDPAVVVTLGTGIGGGLVGGKLHRLRPVRAGGGPHDHPAQRRAVRLREPGMLGAVRLRLLPRIRIAQEAMGRTRAARMWELCQGDRFPRGQTYPFQAARLGDLSAKRRCFTAISRGCPSA